jgi:hypothetical protein
VWIVVSVMPLKTVLNFLVLLPLTTVTGIYYCRIIDRLSSDHDKFSQGLYAGGPCSVLYPTHSPIYN